VGTVTNGFILVFARQGVGSQQSSTGKRQHLFLKNSGG
jgi:hypothetical protein